MSFSKRIDEARKAYRRKDLSALELAHDIERIRHPEREPHGASSSSYVGEMVYGGLDGIITTFAVVSGVAGARLSADVVIILGVANLLADGFSMATGSYLSARSQRQLYEMEMKREAHEVEHFPEAEREELVQAYKARGFTEEESQTLADIYTKSAKRWVEAMMVDELGMIPDIRNPLMIGLATFIAFNVAGFVPLLAYVVGLFVPLSMDTEFLWTTILSGIALFLLGGARTLITGFSLWRSGLEMLFVGGIAGAVAFAVGRFLAKLGLGS
ncbi:MAG TPA: VIT1/CCC1 transporter family protein [Fimbriimonadales bacterium]|nr:VIT1/CCC1 transporter family protein [Fimbriimonadales bacterium]